MPNQRRNASARDYISTVIPSSNPFSVSPRTITARIACHDWKPSETLSRGDTTWESVWPLPGALRRLSRPITRAYHSIGSPYQSNCINGYRQGSHSVINRGDSSNVPSHQVSLRLQYKCTKSPSQSAASVQMHYGTKSVCSFSTLVPSHQVSLELQYTCTIEPSQSRASVQTYYRTNVLSNKRTIVQMYYRTNVLSNKCTTQNKG